MSKYKAKNPRGPQVGKYRIAADEAADAEDVHKLIWVMVKMGLKTMNTVKEMFTSQELIRLITLLSQREIAEIKMGISNEDDDDNEEETVTKEWLDAAKLRVLK